MIEGLINLHNASGCNDIVVTGGTEIGHSRGSESHFNGYKIDIRSRNPGTDEKNCISRYIEANYSYIGNRQGDNAELYQDRRNVSNPDPGVYAHESRPPHWDIR